MFSIDFAQSKFAIYYIIFSGGVDCRDGARPVSTLPFLGSYPIMTVSIKLSGPSFPWGFE
jgi:hypothetical protein